MLSCQKNLNLNSYVRYTFMNFFTSQFFYSTPNTILQLKQLKLRIQTRKNKKIHYFYLWLSTRQNPYLGKYHFKTKNIFTSGFAKAKPKWQQVEVTLRKKHILHLLHEILWQMVSKQTNAEKKIWTYECENVQLKMFLAPLTLSTFSLRAKNSYFPTIPLTIKFHFPYTTAFEKLFFLRGLKFLSPDSKIKGLDLF